jgi:predicted DNA-binding antitoxin AbrB/MazE fold protein
MNYEERNLRKNEQQDAANPTSENEKRVPARIKINPVEMEGTYKSKLITSVRLCAMVNKIMRGVSPDFDGSRLQVVGSNIVGELFFTENPHTQLRDGQIKVIERRDSSKARDVAGAIERYNRRNRSATQYELTQEGKEAFAEFVPHYFVTNRDKGTVDWGRATTEDAEMGFNGRNKIYVKMQFDLHKFLRKVYGGKAADQSNYIYEIGVLRPLDGIKLENGNIVSTKWLLNILQVDEASVRETYEESGFSPLQNTLNIVR